MCVCDVCVGAGKPVSGRPCICQGERTCAAERVGLRLRVMKAEDRLYQVAKHGHCFFGGLLDCNCIVCEIKREVSEAVSR